MLILYIKTEKTSHTLLAFAVFLDTKLKQKNYLLPISPQRASESASFTNR